jgi:hypothetical protein
MEQRMTKKLRMTEQERVAEAAKQTAGLSDEERADKVKETATKLAKEVGSRKKTDARPKHATSERRTPGQEVSKGPNKRERDPLQGVTVDPDENYPKLLHMVVSVGAEDTRSMDELVADVKSALLSHADAKMATVLLNQYASEGKHILAHAYDQEVARLRPSESDASE